MEVGEQVVVFYLYVTVLYVAIYMYVRWEPLSLLCMYNMYMS